MKKNWNSTNDFKSKIMITSEEYNRLKQKLQSNPNTVQGQSGPSIKKQGSRGMNVKILEGLSRHISSSSEKTNTINESSGSSGSEQMELLKVENEYFKKIYDEALSELSKLKNKLKE